MLKFFLNTFCFLLFTSYLFPQAGYDVNVNKGSTTILTWVVVGDYSGYDSLYFVVKACTTSGCGWLVGPTKKVQSVTYEDPYTTVVCTVYAANTAGLNSAKYFYSIYAYGDDTIAVRSGLFNLILNGQSNADGIATTGPVHILAVDSSDKEPGVSIFRDSDNSVDYIDFDELADSLGVSLPFDSTGLSTGQLYFLNGVLRRKF